ncbi:MAG: DUF2309 domain-containing protein [Gammaproteobacteria bacterium]
MNDDAGSINDLRALIGHILDELDHVLPGQAPILDFVHHNTLHGYQHLPFEEALAEAEKMTGIYGYWPESRFRECYRHGRIDRDDLEAALAHFSDLNSRAPLLTVNGATLLRKDLLLSALLFDLDPISESRLNWNIEELGALESLQDDVPAEVRSRFLQSGSVSRSERDKVAQLWSAVLEIFGLSQTVPHPEDMLDLSEEQAEEWLALAQREESPATGRLNVHARMRVEAAEALQELLAAVGDRLTLRGALKAVTGIDVLEAIRPQLTRFCAAALDEGFAPWQLPEREALGLYACWRRMIECDMDPLLLEPDWGDIAGRLPDDAATAIIEQLTFLQLPKARWAGYLRNLALEIPGWSGMINWRRRHPGYRADLPNPVDLADYLAIRLLFDRVWIGQICKDLWNIEARLSALESYFSRNFSEFLVRNALFKGELPEYLAQKTETLLLRARSERSSKHDWQRMADQIYTWRWSPLACHAERHYHWTSAWQLFRLCQHLAVDAEAVAAWSQSDAEKLLAQLNGISTAERGKVWLYAYERNYRERLFQVLAANRGRGRWVRRDRRPQAQVVFCMDEREESFRRHLEELNPAIETLGAAGFFGVPMYYKGIDDSIASALCPIVVTPQNAVEECVVPGHEDALRRHRKGRSFNLKLGRLLLHSLRHRILGAHLGVDVAAPVALFALLAKVLRPNRQRRGVDWLVQKTSPPVPTRLGVTAGQARDAGAGVPAQGFSDQEQADRVSGLLRSMGLTHGFAPLVVLVGHGSLSQNNPHLAAYDCGACSGRHGGPNARAFAAMANRPEVRALLSERGIVIPDDVWFVGAEHNTCNERVTWFDPDLVPHKLQPALESLAGDLRQVRRLSAHERCRRLASAPRDPSLDRALSHIEERADDFSQARPELGHATNACALIGRRSVSQGAFFDRRMFLISYDPTQDPEGLIVENILLAVGPVGAGINLEYYFSSVDNERYGCSTKVLHNVVGCFGVMEGANSDLRTGLPNQMVEIHEPMRLQVIVEAKTEILERIYGRQAALRELIANGWIHLHAIDPDSGEIFMFERGTGFQRWPGSDLPVRTVAGSRDAYGSEIGPVAPALIRQPEIGAA